MNAQHGQMSGDASPLAAVKGGMDLCVHCGFCLQACPTYLVLEDENDSPRGRIVLMRGLLDGDIQPDDPALHTHISRCLGCRGCETACPSGVPFGHLLEATRATLREHRATPFVGRVLLALVANPVALAIVMFFGRLLRRTGVARMLARIPGSAGAPFLMLAATSPGRFSRNDRREVRPTGSEGEKLSMSVDAAATRAGSQGDSVALFEGCIMRELFDHVHRSSRNVLALNGYELVDAAGQGCCGALHAHSGDMDRARSLARANIAAFERIPAEHVAVNAAGCGAMLKEYAALLADDADWSGRARSFSSRVADITELLEARGPLPGAPLNVTVAYDAPCHLQHAQRITSAPLALFRAIPGVTLLQSPDSDKCCGAAGIYNLIEPATSNAVLKPKLDELLESGAQVVSTGNPGCMMQIGAGLLRMRSYVQVAHPVELLDMSYRERRDG